MKSMIAAVPQMRSWHDGGLFMGMHWFWWFVWIGIILVVAWGLVRLFADRSRTHEGGEREGVAEEDLRGRFARGEIDEEEYERRLKVLRDTHRRG
jgi:putative membrane protein